MSTETKVQTSFLEKIGETFSSLGEGFVKVLSLVMGGSRNERLLKTLGYDRLKKPEDPSKPYRVVPGSMLERINLLEPAMEKLSADELKDLTRQFKERLAKGETLDDILPEVFAACREAGKRTKKMRHFDVQLIGGMMLHRGTIAEMTTGEGKTLVATLPAYLNALTGEGVHIVTVNDYLARRDCEWMSPIYNALGIKAGFIQSDMDARARRAAYDCDITYGTNSEFGFDYLRDNMKPARWGDDEYDSWYQQVSRKLNFALIDEVDNILIDEARTPLIISGPAHGDTKRYEEANRVAVQLSDLQKREPGKYYEIKEKEHTCHLTDEGVRKAEELVGVESFYTPGNMEWPHLIDNSLKAHHLYQRDKKYLVMPAPDTREMSIIIIDEFTGRAMFGRQWSDGLHQAVEAKHARDGVKIKQENQTLATITLQNFFKMYKKLAGMTGTAMTEADEFYKIYSLEVIAMPTNRLMRRGDSADLIYRTDKEKWGAILEEVVNIHNQGRPMLIGTTDVAKSELLAGMLKRKGVKYELLNAKPENVARESEIVAQAGRLGAVTIATNMAGRGTDIVLGGNAEPLAWAQLKDQYPSRLEVPDEVWKELVEKIEIQEKMKEEKVKVIELGGLHIIGTERHESRRIDNQLRGRAGRQGDPGSSRFYVSLQDDLMRMFAGEWVANVLTRLGMEEGQAIESRMVSKRIAGAQKKVEERNFEIRKNLLEYDKVMDQQRKRTYGTRQSVLEGRNCKILILDMIEKQIDSALERFLDPNYGSATFAEFAENKLGVPFDDDYFADQPFGEAARLAYDKTILMVPTFIQDAMDENLSIDDDPKDWKWQELSRVIAARYGLKYNDRQLRTIGRENLSETLNEEARKVITSIDLSEGQSYLDPDFGIQSLARWMETKFAIKVPAEVLADQAGKLREILLQSVTDVYRERDVQFPVLAAMAGYMSEHSTTGGGQKYNREGLYAWALTRFPTAREQIKEDDFRTQSRSKLMDLLLGISRSQYPTISQEMVDDQLNEAFEGARVSEAADANELSEWAKTSLQLEIDPAKLTGIPLDKAREVMWSAYDRRYRPEMRGMERDLVLQHLDSSWKKHLLTMDHLRSGIGLRSYAQEDPKVAYTRDGMKEFEVMWVAFQDRVTDAVFRVEDVDDGQVMNALWAGANATKEQTKSAIVTGAPAANTGLPEGVSTNSSTAGEKKKETIRNMGARVGRNDPCPCGSGKKYKNCHMRETSNA